MKSLPATPNAAAVDIQDLAPLLGLEPANIVLSTDTTSAAATAIQTSLVAAGWKSRGGQEIVDTYSKTVGGKAQQLVVIPTTLTDLAALSPFVKVIADHLATLGKSVIIYGFPVA